MTGKKNIIRINCKQNALTKKNIGNGGIRTHAIEMTGALNQRLRPLGHATLIFSFTYIYTYQCQQFPRHPASVDISILIDKRY